jgi:D-alanine--poly(phosphoribitol) ligase subunit 1
MTIQDSDQAALPENMPENLVASIRATLIKHWQNSGHDLAVKDSHQDYSWQQLILTAAGLAKELQTLSTGHSLPPVIPILVGRDADFMPAVLACLLSGCAFAPIALDQPVARIQYIMEELGARLAINAQRKMPTDHLPFETILSVKAHRKEVAADDINWPAAMGGNLLYVLFTSGSTGQPKGVMATHDNIINTLLWSLDILDWQSEDRIGNACAFSFDIAMFDVFTCLTLGVPMIILPTDEDPVACLAALQKDKATSIMAAPMFFAQFWGLSLLPQLGDTSLRRIMAGGDFFPPRAMLAWRETLPNIDVYNIWGPTETSIVNTMHKVTAADLDFLRQGQSPPVGQAHPRMKFVLWDDAGQAITKPGEIGEIVMQGRSVTKGYWQNAALTQEQYCHHQNPPAFRTMDLGHLDEEGRLFIRGRKSSLVKIAGFRVELPEVEHHAVAISGVRSAGAYVVSIGPGEDVLHLAIEPFVFETFDVFAFKQELRRRLPAYMIPKVITPLMTMPLNVNGKIDRKNLGAWIKKNQEENEKRS